MPFTEGFFGVEWEEYFQGWAESWSEDNVSLYRGAVVPWAGGKAFVSDMIGGAYRQGHLLRRYLPEQHPVWPKLYVSQVDLLQPHGAIDAGGALGSIAYDYYLYRLHYTPRPYEVLSDDEIDSGANVDENSVPLGELSRFVERQQSYAVQNVTVPGGSFGWSDAGVTAGKPTMPIMEAQWKVMGSKELTYIWHLVPGVPDGNIQDAVGTVNDALFDDLYPPETLLFPAPEVVRIPLSPGGNPLWRLTYKMQYRKQGWNKLYRQTAPTGGGGPGFYAVDSKGDGTGTKPFTATDFNKLFQL